MAWVANHDGAFDRRQGLVRPHFIIDADDADDTALTGGDRAGTCASGIPRGVVRRCCEGFVHGYSQSRSGGEAGRMDGRVAGLLHVPFTKHYPQCCSDLPSLASLGLS